MTQQCPLTCNRCNVTVTIRPAQPTSRELLTALDTSRVLNEILSFEKKEIERKYLCNDPLYYQLMTEQCPLTCNRCNGTSAGIGSSKLFRFKLDQI
ncbi:unnamed protein product [Strongylus vulgaris]|uniref:ShKT domain-containing protein n=1 Tax=Strongylus vulgaris TaxID=40348 RepID=A0A3P7J8B8_STRVU|nr:unnamed protein product [Strongylus vulgaris]